MILFFGSILFYAISPEITLFKKVDADSLKLRSSFENYFDCLFCNLKEYALCKTVFPIKYKSVKYVNNKMFMKIYY